MDWLIIVGAAALVVRVGQGLYAAGACRSKNSAGQTLRVVCDLCVAVLAFWAVGAAILFQGNNGYFALRATLLFGWAPDMAGGWLFQAAVVVLVATGALSGPLAERSRFLPLCAASALLAGLIVPTGWRWASEGLLSPGWLARMGFVDAAGASWAHVAGGLCAAVGAVLVGPRTGKYHRDGSASMIPGHNVPLMAVGALMMLAGWVPYVATAAAARASENGLMAINVLLAAAAGGMSAILVAHARYGKPDVLLTLLGLLGGLVAITAGAGAVGTPSAVAIGAVAGILVPLAAVTIDLLVRIDDPTGGIAVHVVGGAWGTVAVGLFAPGSFGQRLQHLGVQVLGLLVIAALSVGLSLGLFLVLRATVGLRAKEADEFDGLDLAEHDIGAYPDFQQTTIKSYHLREA
jgi:Amt family ammonium transporter